MRRTSQRGMTLIELLVALAVTSILLVGLGSVLFDVSKSYQGWANRLDRASTGAGLATNLQADSHRYVVCTGSVNGTFEGFVGGTFSDQPFLDLCPADASDPSHLAVRYQVSGRAPYVISRQPAGQTAAFLVRSPGTDQPKFWADCVDAGNAISGHIHVNHLRLDDGAGGSGGNVSPANFSVYYTAPRPRDGCP